MRFVLVYPEIRTSFPNYTGGYSEGIASILTTLRSLGHEVQLVHITRVEQMARDRLIKQIGDFRPDLVGFSSMSPNFPHARTINDFVKSDLKVPTIIGGCHAQFRYAQILEKESFDFIAVGEGEAILPGLFQALDEKRLDIDLPGIITRQHPIPRDLDKCLVQDLNSLPIPDRSFFDFPNLRESLECQAQFMAGRGCPFECTYCANKIHSDMFGTRKVRMKSPQRVIEEILGVLKQHPFITNIFFQDDILPLYRKWLDEFAELYREKVKLPFVCNIHPNLIERDVLKLLKSLDCRSVQMGVESGSQRVRNDVLKRRMTNEDIIRRVELCHEHGMECATFNILGNYSETFDEALQTIKLNAKLGPVRAYSTIFIPYPGTQLNKTCIEANAFSSGAEPADFPEYTEYPIISNPDFPPEKVVFLKNWFGVLIRLYRQLPEALMDRILHKKRFPYAFLNALTRFAKPLAIRLYLGFFVKLKNRFK
ncbi:B12-binding domain-containing radical SAM protein [Candidatus Ozemobacteraceae bacterium]|nr:B12-binding domain-containing radical SAM protein [Candidatus Ozemobacteraceae bacterium]